MAIPSYTEDLTDISTAETVTGYSALGGGQAGLSADVDFAIQGTNSITKQVTGAGVQKGMLFDFGTPITMGANDHVFAWIYATCPGLLESLSLSGMTVTIGSTVANYNDYSVAGNDTYSKGGHFCYPIRYTTGTPSPGTQTGTPGANPQWFGGQITVTGTLRAANLAVDASRYGTGAYITAGEIANPGTFLGFATQNDLIANQWGILSEIAGGFVLQGRFVIGQTTALTPTLAYFDDSNANIVFADTPHSLTDFTQVIIDHASSTLIWDNVSFTALGTNNPGRVVFNNASTIGTITGGTWTSIGIITLRAGVTALGLTWRTCDQIAQNGATLTDCFIDGTSSTSAILSDNPSLITGTDFPGGGTGHAVRCDTPGTYNWTGNTDTGYTGTRGTNLVSNSGSTDAMFYNNSGGLITLNVGGGADQPSVRNGAGATTVVAATVTILVQGLTEGAAAKVVANETVGTITIGDVILESLVDVNGEASISLDYEGAFEPTGLDVITRCRASGLPTAAIQDDNGVFTDETTAANKANAAVMNLLPAVPVVNEDRYLFGHPEKFGKVKIDINTAGTGGFTITWEYWNGATWASLTGVTDGTSSFSVAGLNYVEFTIPGDWATTTINTQGPYYYIRAAYTAGTVTTVPTGTRCSLDVTKYLPFVQSGIITSSGLSVTASWVEDTIAKFKPI